MSNDTTDRTYQREGRLTIDDTVNEEEDFVEAQKAAGKDIIPVSPGYVNTDPRFTKQGEDIDGETEYFLLKVRTFESVVNAGEPGTSRELIKEFYQEISQLNQDRAMEGKASLHTGVISHKTRCSYANDLANELTMPGPDGETPEYRQQAIDRLCLEDEQVGEYVETMAAIQLGETSVEQLQKKGLGTYIRHETTVKKVLRKASADETRMVGCGGGSRMVLREQYQELVQEPGMGIQYNLGHSVNDCSVTETINTQSSYLGIDVPGCLEGIEQRRTELGAQIGPDDNNLIAMYTNFEHIFPRDPSKRLPIVPPEPEKQ